VKDDHLILFDTVFVLLADPTLTDPGMNWLDDVFAELADCGWTSGFVCGIL
jgi:hypothetical protein